MSFKYTSIQSDRQTTISSWCKFVKSSHGKFINTIWLACLKGHTSSFKKVPLVKPSIDPVLSNTHLRDVLIYQTSNRMKG